MMYFLIISLTSTFNNIKKSSTKKERKKEVIFKQPSGLLRL